MRATPEVRSEPSRRLLGLAGFLALGLALAALGLYATTETASGRIASMQVPWTPPLWLVRTAWLCLDLAVGVAGWLLWRERGERPGANAALVLFGIATALHVVWLITFLVAAPRPGQHLWVVLLVLLLFDLASAAVACGSWSVSRRASVLLFVGLAGQVGGTALALGDTLLALAT